MYICFVSVLQVISKNHKEWVRLVSSFGGGDTSEDIVQDVYLRIYNYKYGEKIVKDGKINHALMWSILRNATHDQNKNNKIKLISIEATYNLEDKKIEFDEFSSLERLHEKIRDEILSWHWYDTMLFSIYLESNLSMRDIAKKANISLTSIFNTIKNCKDRLKENVGEEWTDYCNEDFELI